MVALRKYCRVMMLILHGGSFILPTNGGNLEGCDTCLTGRQATTDAMDSVAGNKAYY